MDAATSTWSEEILAALDIPVDLMPEIVSPGTVLGDILAPLAAAVDLNRAKLIAVGSHDTASAYAAAPVENPDEALIISSGTWSIVGKLLPSPITSDDAMQFNMANEGGIGNVRFLRNCMGTWPVQELRRIWRIVDGHEMPWEDITRLTKEAPAFTALIDPDDQRFFNPSNMQEAILSFCTETNQTVPSDRGTTLRIVYESLAMKYRYVNEKIVEITGKPTSVVNIVGGGSKNTLLNQFTANATGLRVVAGPEEATAVGNVMVQALGLGLIDSLGDALPIIRATFPIVDIEPQDPDPWDKAYQDFKKIIQDC